MNQPLKYEFAPFAGTARGANGAAPAPRRRLLGEDEIEAIRAVAMAEGEARGRAAAEAATEHARTEAIAGISKSLATLAGGFCKTRASLETGAASLAIAIGRAIAGQALDHAPLDAIRPLVAEALDRAVDGTRIVVEVDASLVPAVEAEVERLAEEAGFSGRVRVRAGNGRRTDCRIDWGDGGLERRLADITTAILDRLAAQGVAAPTPDALET